MKKFLLIVIVGFSIYNYASGQVLCIYCYEQNAPISASANNLIQNGGFENGCSSLGMYFCPNSTGYSCDITNWTCTGGGYNTYAQIYTNSCCSIVIEGSKAAYFGNQFCRACSSILGDTLCLTNKGCEVLGVPAGYPLNPNPGYAGDTGVSLQQTVPGLIPGNIYVLEFWAGGEQGSFPLRGLFAVDVGFGKIYLRNKSTPTGNGIGTRFIIEFRASTSSHTIKFTNWGHISTNHTELVLDDVRLYTLAELSSVVPPCINGINEFNENSSLTVHPNPFTTQLNITVADNESYQLILYDITSRKLLQQSFLNSTSMNTSHLAEGIYFYELRYDNGVIKKGKVVKE
jgi:hypothetical protein